MVFGLGNLGGKERKLARQELKILKEDVVAAKKFILANKKNYFGGKSKLPIYLILGPERFGKTTILSQAGLDLIDVNYQALKKVTPTKYCSFWFTREALYIDTAGNYTKPEIARLRNDLIWQGFIRLLQRYFGRRAIVGTLAILDLPAFIQDKNLFKRSIFCIRERIYEMAVIVKKIKVHLVFTKCDRIVGFKEFFDSLTGLERLQPFGITFGGRTRNLMLEFEEKFNELVQGLNNRLIDNLQRFSDKSRSHLVKHFVSSFDHLRGLLVEVIGKIPNSKEISLGGVYFTSSIQDGKTIDPIKSLVIDTFALRSDLSYKPEVVDQRSYFVEEIFKNIIRLQSTRRRDIGWLRSVKFNSGLIYLVAISLAIIGAFGAIAYHSYHKNLQVATKLLPTLQNKILAKDSGIYQDLIGLQQEANSWQLKLGINKVKTIYLKLSEVHQRQFVANLAEKVESYLAAAISSQELNNVKKIYDTLQLYLILGEPGKGNRQLLINWCARYLSDFLPTIPESLANDYLVRVIKSKFKINLNQNLISAVRDSLKSRVRTEVLYLAFENSIARKTLDQKRGITIPAIYFKNTFHQTFESDLRAFAVSLPKNDWVLGELAADPSPDLLYNLRDLYLHGYVNEWLRLLKSEANFNGETITDFENFLAQAISKDAPLFLMLKVAADNLAVSKAPVDFTKLVDRSVGDISAVRIENVRKALQGMLLYFNTLGKSNDQNQVAFISLVEYLHQKGAENPIAVLHDFAGKQILPVREYLNKVVDKAWRVVANSSYRYISSRLQQDIIPVYRKTLDNRYPLFNQSKEEVSLKDFNQFFAPYGLMDNFFNNYIEPIIKIDKANWQWQEIDGHKLDFPADLLEVFLRAALIQKIFYPLKGAAPKVMFDLKPVAMTPNTQSFSLHLDGQKVVYLNDDNKPTQTLEWPGPKAEAVTFSFVDSQGKFITSSEFGPWAWFRLLDKIGLAAWHNSTQKFELTFELNGNAVKYLLTTKDAVNPFVSEIVSGFRLR